MYPDVHARMKCRDCSMRRLQVQLRYRHKSDRTPFPANREGFSKGKRY